MKVQFYMEVQLIPVGLLVTMKIFLSGSSKSLRSAVLRNAIT